MGNASISKQIVRINLPLLLILLITYLTVSVCAIVRQDAEDAEYTAKNLKILENSIENEKLRLRNLFLFCAGEPDFVMALSGKQTESFMRYGMQVSSKLSAIRFSLPYADRVFAYTASKQKFILSGNAMWSKDTFVQEFGKQLQDEEIMPDFESLRDGYYIFHDFILYVVNVQNYGCICVQFKPEAFLTAAWGTPNSGEYEALVLTEKKQIFASTLQPELEAALNAETLWTEKEFSAEDRNFSVSRAANPVSGYSYYIFSDADIGLKQYYQTNILFVAGVIVVLGISVLVIVLNAKMYRPLREIVSQFSEKNHANEFLAIQRELSDLSTRNREMGEKVSSMQAVRREFVLQYLMNTSDIPKDGMLDTLRLEYTRFQVIGIVLQSQQGEASSSALERLSACLCGEYNCIEIGKEAFSAQFIWNPADGDMDIAKRLSAGLDISSPVGVFVGVSAQHTDITELRQAASEAAAAIDGIEVNRTYDQPLQIGTLKVGSYNKKDLSLEDQNSFVNCVLTMSPQDIAVMLDKLLFLNGSVPLGGMRTRYETLAALRRIILQMANLPSETEPLPGNPVYHPRFAYDVLLHCFCGINSLYKSEKGSLKYQVTEYVNLHYAEEFSLGTVAEVFNLSPSYFSTWFKKAVGCTFSAYLSGIRMEAAGKILLSKPALRVNEVSELVGIASIVTFNRQFKAYMGTTPEQFRKNNKGEQIWTQ